MIRFIWNNWWRHKQRFILLLIGALIISSGLSLLVGLSNTNKGTIVDALQKRWTASYDIVVRPTGTRSVTEDKDLLEPNYLSGISGGISLEQYNKIKGLDNVSVAAPIAMIGYINYNVVFEEYDVNKRGIYRVSKQTVTDTGPRKIKEEDNYYFPIGWSVINKGAEYGVGIFDGKLRAGTQVLLAGIDPEQEAKLVGLDEAVLDIGNSQYFQGEDPVSGSANGLKIPILVNNKEFVDITHKYTVSRLDLPFQDMETANSTMEMVKKRGGEEFLDTVKAKDGKSYSFTSVDAHKLFVESVTGIDLDTGKKIKKQHEVDDSSFLVMKPSPLPLEPVSSPFTQRWPFAYNVEVQRDETPAFPSLDKETFRPVNTFGEKFENWPRINPYWVGFYNPGKLDISKDPLTELPMETYRPASAKLFLDAQENPVNPPIEMKPSDQAFGYLTKPPSMLTTIEAAAEILGDKPISAIRVNVKGVETLNKESQKRLEEVANQIEKETGLITDITLGSSPQPALTHIPAKGDLEELGWIQQPWVKIGSSFSIFKETKVGFSGVIGSVIAVAVVYVFASGLVSLFARRKEFAVLLAIGWQPRQLSKMIYLESMLLGTFVAVVAWTILGWIMVIYDTETSIARLLIAGLLGFVIYWLGAVIPAMLTKRIAPYEAINSGEISKASTRILKARSIYTMGINHFVGKWRRSILSIIAISVPTGLLAFFLFITFRLKGIMYTTWLGQYVSLEVGTAHYVAMVVALFIAILTTAEIMWQNVTERKPEIALLKAVGWRDSSVRLIVLLEGAFSGLCAGIVGLLLAFGFIWGMYQQLPVEHIGFLLATGVIPVVTGVAGAILPAERAVRILPTEGVRGQYANQKITEKRFLIALRVGFTVLIIGFGTMIATMAPKMINMDDETVTAPKMDANPTEGDISSPEVNEETVSSENDNPAKQDNEPSLEYGADEFYEEIPPGESFLWGNLVVTVDKITELPVKIELKKPPEGMKYISVLMTAKNTTDPDEADTSANFIPATTYLQIDKELKEYADITYLMSEEYEAGKIASGGEIKVILTYEVPKAQNEFNLVHIRKRARWQKILFKVH